tara:strand:- start:31 stop:210 length:180 start_codon:yes stop_codon:yes gene_type:complete
LICFDRENPESSAATAVVARLASRPYFHPRYFHAGAGAAAGFGLTAPIEQKKGVAGATP